MKVVVIGAGMGGLSAALRLARLGHQVQVVEARATSGGLAAATEAGECRFDSGPYLLLDRPGLEWAFEALELDLPPLDPVDHIYRVTDDDGETVDFHHDLDHTADLMEARWAGHGARYRWFVDHVRTIHDSLRPLLFEPPVHSARILSHWRSFPFLLRSLGQVLGQSGLAPPIINAIAIWTHIAGQKLETAPSPLAFVPALMHSSGAWYPPGGMHVIPRALEHAGREAGVTFRFDTRVERIILHNGRVAGVRASDQTFLPAEAVVSNANGVGTYVQLLNMQTPLQKLPQQSPGVCAYLKVSEAPGPPYLRFRLPHDGTCRLLITPGARMARLLSPLRQSEAEELGEEGQRALLDQLLAESWWQEGLGSTEVVHTRVPVDWGREFHLYRDSMNPIMTAAFMRAGRMAHRSPWVPGLYLAGSSTHPGQWISFCAISGILAADLLHQDDAGH